jgi:hypothetical protein
VRLLSIAITTAIATTTSPVYQAIGNVLDMTLQANFTRGSGGAACDVFVQTSIDGVNWTDIANFHFTTSSQRYMFNLSSSTPVTAQYTATDGTLTANTCVDGILGSQFRCKYSSSGTYGGNTSLTIDAVSSARLEPL